MGCFWGHIFIGTVFIKMSLWWTYHAFRQHIRCVSQGKEFIPQTYFGSSKCCVKNRRLPPVEICARILLPVIGFLSEFFAAGFGFKDENGDFRKTINMAHCSLYGLFVIQGFVELISWMRFPVPKNLNYLLLAISFLWFAVGFYLHELHAENKMPLERICHQLQIISLVPTGVALLFEMVYRKGFTTVFVRILGGMTVGSWFIQMSFMLFIHDGRFPGTEPAPQWNQRDMRNVHFAMAAYGAHIAMNIVILLTFYLFLAFVYRRSHGLEFVLTADGDKIQYKDITRGKKAVYDENINLSLLCEDYEGTD
ncbi:transmembrane protein 45B [Patella vulgata]|uniref:transmembrane protein 45B n=1 Tax=Patella vulgata TaxID=6465 RepID=UPI00218032A8|nr:transmembrane protein 45B [Patella vulgata]XP_050401919.1 transmembrane protein 45B [Patella vulgata]